MESGLWGLRVGVEEVYTSEGGIWSPRPGCLQPLGGQVVYHNEWAVREDFLEGV